MGFWFGLRVQVLNSWILEAVVMATVVQRPEHLPKLLGKSQK